MNESINNKSSYDDLEEFFAIKERIHAEIEEEKKISEINNVLQKRKNKLSVIQNKINQKNYLTNKDNCEHELIKKQIDEKISAHDTFTKFNIDLLLAFVFHIIKEINTKQIFKNFIVFLEQKKNYEIEANNYIKNNNYNIQHNYILMKMKEHIKLNIPLNLIKNDNITKKYIREKDKKQYLRMDFVLFKNEVMVLKEKTLLLCNNLKEQVIISNIDNKQKKLQIIDIFYKKFFEKFNYTNINNQIENELYNGIIKHFIDNNSILFITQQMSLPVVFKNPLVSDIFVVLNINEHLHFCVIEYDGPTHYDYKNSRFSKENIERDKIKNNFCIKNKISLCRISYINNNFVNLSIKFIYDVLKNNNEPIVQIPSDEEYNNIIRDFDNYSESVLNEYINKMEHKIPIKKSHVQCISNGCQIFNSKNNNFVFFIDQTNGDYYLNKK